jgi:hypothetical protein
VNGRTRGVTARAPGAAKLATRRERRAGTLVADVTVTMTPARFAAIGLCMLTACAEEEEPRAYHLSEVDDLRVGLFINASSDAGEAGLRLSVMGGELISLGADFGLRVNDYPAMRGRDHVHSGRAIPELPSFPEVTMMIPAEHRVAPAEVVVTDGVDEIVFSLGDALLPRSATWVQPASGILAANDEIAVQWSPATDALGDDVYAFVTPQPQFAGDVVVTSAVNGVLAGTTGSLEPAPDVSLIVGWRSPARDVPCFSGTCQWGVEHVARVAASIAAP